MNDEENVPQVNKENMLQDDALKYKLVLSYTSPDRYKICALRDIPAHDVKAGDLGGEVAGPDNLSHQGTCWIGPGAYVCDSARVNDHAYIGGTAMLSENAVASGYAQVTGNAAVMEKATVSDYAVVSDSAYVCGKSAISGRAVVSGRAHVHLDSVIKDNVRVSGDGTIIADSTLSGTVEVFNGTVSRSKLSGRVFVINGTLDCVIAGHDVHVIGSAVNANLDEDVAASIYAQTLQCPVNGKVILYKAVCDASNSGRTRFASLADPNFVYEVGKEAVAEIKPGDDDPTLGCASGLHCSHLRYWDQQTGVSRIAYLMVEVALDDVIAVQSGKVRCRKLKVLCEVPGVKQPNVV